MLKTLEKKPLEELVKLRADLDKLIKKRQREQKKEAKPPLNIETEKIHGQGGAENLLGLKNS